MPQTDGGARSHYPLASGSGSRRRLMLFGLTGPAYKGPADDATPEAERLSVLFDDSGDPDDLDSSMPLAEATAAVAEPSSIKSSQQRPGFQAVRELLAGTKPLTWVFTGDGATAGVGLDIERRSFVELFAARLRRDRAADAVINTAVSGETAGGLLDDLEWRSLRFRPDVVVVMLGIDDALAEPLGCEAFGDRLARLVECIRADGAIPVLQTPHRVPERGPLDVSALRARVKAIRQIAADTDVPCVDHWGRWKRKQSSGTQVEGWLNADGLHPDAAGHIQLAGLICTCFGLGRGDDPGATSRAENERPSSAVVG